MNAGKQMKVRVQVGCVRWVTGNKSELDKLKDSWGSIVQVELVGMELVNLNFCDERSPGLDVSAGANIQGESVLKCPLEECVDSESGVYLEQKQSKE